MSGMSPAVQTFPISTLAKNDLITPDLITLGAIIMSSSSDSSDRYSSKTCEMRKVNGDPCTSPALNGKRFCHYHDKMGPSPINIDNDAIPSSHVYLPQLEDAASIQSAISEVCEGNNILD
jgi:hypothetical protein